MNSFFFTNFILNSPFEGFKLETYFFNFGQYSDVLYVNNWTFIPFFSFGSEPAIWTLASSGIGIFIVYIIISGLYNASFWNQGYDHFTTIQVILILLGMSLFTFFGSTLSMIFNVSFLAENNIVIEEKLIKFFNLEVSFIKDIWGFLTIFIVARLLTSQSFAQLTLIPNGDLDRLSDSMYKFSLDLFTSTLDIRKEKEVQAFQEFFLKVNGLFMFILGANLVGMIPYSTTITSSLMNTFFIAFAIFVNIIIVMVNEKGINHLFDLFLPSGCPMSLILLLVPIEVLSYCFRLISLSVRLFANMLAGHTLMKVFSGFSWSLLLLGDSGILLHYLPVLVLFALTVLELGVACIQAYVFVVLTYLYLRDIFVGH